MLKPEDKMIDIGWPMHVRFWQQEVGEKRPFRKGNGRSPKYQVW